MNRSDFLKRFGLGAAAPIVALAARKLDPDGEPVSEGSPLIVMNGEGQTLSNFSIDTSQSRGTAVQVNRERAIIQGGFIKQGT